MFFKLISLSITAILLIVAYVNMDTHESPILIPPKNEVEKEVSQVSPQQKEHPLIKDECKNCIPSGIHDEKKEPVIPLVSAQEISSKEETNSADSPGETSFSYPKMPQYTQTEKHGIQHEAIFISPFSK